MNLKRHKLRHRETQELNITAFMNLMVILVPFLLITAVFSRMTILPLNLPSSQHAAPKKPPLQLQVILRQDAVAVKDSNSGEVMRFARKNGHYDIKGLHALMKKLKAKRPHTRSATLLVAPNVDYQDVVNVMDAIRVAGKQSLFPNISIGDAPHRDKTGG